MSKQRILILPSWYPAPSNPLNGIFVHDQAIALSKYYDVAVLTIQLVGWRKIIAGKLGSASQSYMMDEIPVFMERAIVPVPRVSRILIRSYIGAVRSGIKRILDLWGKPELLYAHVVLPMGYAAAIASTEYKVPLVLMEHSSPFSVHLQTSYQRRIVAKTLCSADKVIAVSPSLAQKIQSFEPNAKLEVVGNLVRTDYFTPSPVDSDVAKKTLIRFLTVGFLVKQKGISIVLDTIAILRARGITNFEFIIGGDGELRSALEEKANDLNLNSLCRFLGSLSRQQVLEEMRNCDVFVLASLHETFGIVLGEAMACGKPVIATRCGGPEFVVTPETGFLVEPGDPVALADTMGKFIEGRVAFQETTIRRSITERFGEDAFLARITSVFERVTGVSAVRE